MASPQSNRGEAQRDKSDTGSDVRGATKLLFYNTDALDSEGTADQFWQTQANNQRGVWTNQFLEEGDEYFASMSSYMTNQFNPEFQLVSGLMNPTVEVSSLGSFSRLQGDPVDVHKQLYSFTSDYNNNAFEDCHHQDAFLQHVYEIFWDETEPSVELNQPFARMAAPYEAFHQSSQT